MLDAPFLQSIVCPIGRYIENPDQFEIQQIFGTGFFISDNGLFLTARHVLAAAYADVEVAGGQVGIFPMQNTSLGHRSLTIPISDYEFAPNSIDVALGRTPYMCKTFLKLGAPDVEVWQDIGTMGYPQQTIEKVGGKIELQQRAHKGHIQRCIPAERIRTGPKANSFELNFAITQGMSGAPPFIHRPDYEIVIGVCVGSQQSRVTEYEHIEVRQEGHEFREKIARIEEFGIAHDIRSLMAWRPKLLSNLSLSEATAAV